MYKIVQVIPALGWGGAQVFCLQLCNQFASDPDYDVTLISMYDYKESAHLPKTRLHSRVKFITLGKKKGWDYSLFFKMYKLIKKLQPHVVHTHMHTSFYCLPAYILNRKNKYRKVHTLHSMALIDNPSWYGRLAYKYFFGAKIIQPVCISEEGKKSAGKFYGKSIDTLIENGSAPAVKTSLFESTATTLCQLKKDEHTKILLNVARINKIKNQKLLLQVMQTLQEKNINVVAVILGECVEQDKHLYEELLKIKPGNTHFLGKVNNVSDYCLLTDAFCLTSLQEGLPISLLEAFSAGLIPVCTPAGELAHIVEKNTGFLSKDFAHDSYLQAVTDYLETCEHRVNELKSNCIDLYKKKYSIQSCAGMYEQLYKNHLSA